MEFYFKTVAMRRLGSVVVLLLLVATALSATADAQTTTLGEAVDNTSLTWTTGGDADWFGQTSVYYYDGDAAQSGAPASGQSSWIETTVSGPGLLTFYWKVSPGAFLELDFYLDGTRQAECNNTNWQLKGYSIPSGSHTLRWDYTPFIQSSGDAGWLDKVTYGPQPAIVADVPNGGETLYQREFYTIRWVNSADVTDVKIELYKGGTPFHTVAASTPGDGSYNWFVPLGIEPAADYRVRIAALSNPAVYDESDADFSIAPASQPALNGVLILDGVDDYAEAADHPELDLAGGSFTVEAWVYFRERQWEEVFMKAGAYGLHVETDFSGNHCMWIDYPCLTGCCTSSTYLSFSWHHVALVYDALAGQARAYYDGTQRCSASCAASNSNQPLWVGKGLTGRPMQGAVDELRVSSIARYTGAFTPPAGPFVCDGSTRALWHFDEFEGTTLFHDSCGTVDNFLIGYNGAHTEGVHAYKVYVPLVVRSH